MGAYARWYVPLLLAIIESHDLMGNASLSLARTQSKAKTLKDDRTKIWQLFNLVDRQWRIHVGQGGVELCSQFPKYSWVG